MMTSRWIQVRQHRTYSYNNLRLRMAWQLMAHRLQVVTTKMLESSFNATNGVRITTICSTELAIWQFSASHEDVTQSSKAYIRSLTRTEIGTKDSIYDSLKKSRLTLPLSESTGTTLTRIGPGPHRKKIKKVMQRWKENQRRKAHHPRKDTISSPRARFKVWAGATSRKWKGISTSDWMRTRVP